MVPRQHTRSPALLGHATGGMRPLGAHTPASVSWAIVAIAADVSALRDEIDEAALDLDPGQTDADAVADVEPGLAAHHLALDTRREQAHPGALGRGAGDDGVEALADARAQQQRR